MPQTATPPVVLCIRDPDAANDYIIDGDVQIIDVDLGARFDGPKYFDAQLSPDEQQAWCRSQLAQVADLEPPSPVRQRVVALCQDLLVQVGTAPVAVPPAVTDAPRSGCPVMLVIRDPDWENEVLFDGDVQLIEIDLGARFDGLSDMTHALGLDGAQREVARWRAEVADLDGGSDVRRAVEELAALAEEHLDEAL